MNPSIVKLLNGKHENDAIRILQEYKKTWRIHSRDGQILPIKTDDRNDKRYNLVIYNNKVWRVFAG